MKVNYRVIFSFLVILCLILLNFNSLSEARRLNELPIYYPANGYYKIIPECARDKALAVQNAVKNYDSNVIIDNFNSGGSLWKIERVNNDWYKVVAVHSDLALDISLNEKMYTKVGSGINISTWPFRGENQNKFRFRDAGNGYSAIEVHPSIIQDYVLDVFNRESSAGTNVWGYQFNDTPAQHWILIPTQNPLVNRGMNPEGTVNLVESNSAGTLHVKGTAFDRDNSKGSIRLHVYVGGGAGSGAPSYEIRTNGSNHIFDDTRQVERTGRQWVHIYALNDYSGGENVEIWKGEVEIKSNIVYPMKNMYCTWRSYSNNTWSWSEYNLNKSNPERSYHLGLDVYGNNGYVYATADGIVVSCSNSNNGGGANGRYIVIKHDNIGGQSCYSFYAHLQSVKVSENQRVSAGEHIGIAGGSGFGKDNYYGTHLHFAFVKEFSKGKYYGYATKFSGNKVNYGNMTFYNPLYVLKNGRLPD